MTDRLTACCLLLALLLLQAAGGLHRASADIGHGNTALHQRLFGHLESQAVHLVADNPDDPHSAPGFDAGRACELLDDLLSPAAAAGAVAVLPVCTAQPEVRQVTPPTRLSRFQQLGPPPRGPPPVTI